MRVFSSLDFVKLAAYLLSCHNEPISDMTLVCKQHNLSLHVPSVWEGIVLNGPVATKPVQYRKALEYVITKGTSEN